MKYLSLIVFCTTLYYTLPNLAYHIGSKLSENNKHWAKGFFTGLIFATFMGIMFYVVHKVEHGISLSDWT